MPEHEHDMEAAYTFSFYRFFFWTAAGSKKLHFFGEVSDCSSGEKIRYLPDKKVSIRFLSQPFSTGARAAPDERRRVRIIWVSGVRKMPTWIFS
jgi:hypothetical protein